MHGTAVSGDWIFDFFSGNALRAYNFVRVEAQVFLLDLR